jgi:hypothetical protein
MDTVVCLTLGKWETVSGQFGGYLRDRQMALHFTLDNDFERLNWGSDIAKPTGTEQQAMVIAVATAARALENIALQLNQTLGPLQEIASALHVNPTRGKVLGEGGE